MNSEYKQSVTAKFLQGKVDEIVEKYIKDGPTLTREHLNASEEEWKVLFEYLVFEHNLLYKTVVANDDFFGDLYVKYGTAHVREVLDILESKYDKIWELLFDYLAIAQDGLYYHVMEHRDKYTVAMKARGGDFVRKVLGIWQGKYEENWAKVLDYLLHAVCDAIFSEQTYENSLRSFSMIMNNTRDHRPINKYGLI